MSFTCLGVPDSLELQVVNGHHSLDAAEELIAVAEIIQVDRHKDLSASHGSE